MNGFQDRDSVHQVVFRWDGNHGRQGTGMNAVAHSCPAGRAEELGRDLGPLLWVSGAAAARPSVVRTLSRDGDVMLVQRWPTTDRAGRPSTVSHVLVGSPAVLKTRQCLGLAWGGWRKQEKAEGESGSLPEIDCRRLDELARTRLPDMLDGLHTVEHALILVTAELLRDPAQRVSLLLEEKPPRDWPDPDGVPLVYLGLFLIFGSWLRHEWTFATYDTVDTHPLRLMSVPRWEPDTGGSGPLARVMGRRPARPGLEHRAAQRLVHHVLAHRRAPAGVPHLVGDLADGAALDWERRRARLQDILATGRPTGYGAAAPSSRPAGGGQAPDRDRDPARDGDRDLDVGPDLDRDQDRDRALDRDPDLEPDRDRDRDLDRSAEPRRYGGQERAPEQGQGHDHEQGQGQLRATAGPELRSEPAAAPPQARTYQPPAHEPVQETAQGPAHESGYETGWETPHKPGYEPRRPGSVAPQGPAPGSGLPRTGPSGPTGLSGPSGPTGLSAPSGPGGPGGPGGPSGPTVQAGPNGTTARDPYALQRQLREYRRGDHMLRGRLMAQLAEQSDVFLLGELRSGQLSQDSLDLVLSELGRSDRDKVRDPEMRHALCAQMLGNDLYFTPQQLGAEGASRAAMAERAAVLFHWAVAPLARDERYLNELLELQYRMSRDRHPTTGNWLWQTIVEPPDGRVPDLPPALWRQILQDAISRSSRPSAVPPAPVTTPLPSAPAHPQAHTASSASSASSVFTVERPGLGDRFGELLVNPGCVIGTAFGLLVVLIVALFFV
ncbi:hypothetical protein ACH41H_11710 [Streptomyces sp. NPDC020800]|uniref:hypothetical protein n=1 Tax=Streptomyces sp. NPDC020800 TaxID=3365092 RepID=UPI0037ABE698